jgi:hypothetical protein
MPPMRLWCWWAFHRFGFDTDRSVHGKGEGLLTTQQMSPRVEPSAGGPRRPGD